MQKIKRKGMKCGAKNREKERKQKKKEGRRTKQNNTIVTTAHVF